MKNISNLYAVLFFLLLVSCKQEQHSEYDHLPYRGGKEVSFRELSFDTIRIDASSTSMDGQWAVNQDTLYFADSYEAGVSTFDLNGNPGTKHIKRGRGPNEVMGRFVAITFSPEQDLVGIDDSWNLYCFDTLYRCKYPHYLLHSEVKYEDKDWDELLRNPDVENNYMYEYNLGVKKVKVVGEWALLPIVTEHVHYNGYDLGEHAKEFWAQSYLFQFYNLRESKDLKKFGHYPPIYGRRNIPAFSHYSYDLCGDKIYTTFMADSLIYVRDLEGKLLYSFGCSAGLEFENLPETKTFDEYEKVYDKHLAQYGYYTDLLVTDEYVLRGYKQEGEDQYGIQIYKDHNLIGDVPVNASFNFIGKNGDFYYILLPTDLDEEMFRIVKFRLP